MGSWPASDPVRSSSNSQAQSVNAAIIAHQDDWQLFMGDVLSDKLRQPGRGVLVYLTAGDDGRDSVYWLTRERGALQSTSVALGLPESNIHTCSVTSMLGHSITRCMIGSTESYFLRLPDGGRDGRGFASDRFQSLRKLRAKQISRIDAIDGSASYNSWSDLMATVAAIIDQNAAEVGVHTTDPNIVRNPHDHFDHRMAGLLVADARTGENWRVSYYVGYALATRAANRTTRQTQAKTALFLAYDREMQAADKKWSAYREHPLFYSECLQRTYVRHVPPPARR
ncbi:MAG: PIG-L family deacetylase [Gemmatimonadaceae bacterium]